MLLNVLMDELGDALASAARSVVGPVPDPPAAARRLYRHAATRRVTQAYKRW
jgi:hypothetical protein